MANEIYLIDNKQFLYLLAASGIKQVVGINSLNSLSDEFCESDYLYQIHEMVNAGILLKSDDSNKYLVSESYKTIVETIKSAKKVAIIYSADNSIFPYIVYINDKHVLAIQENPANKSNIRVISLSKIDMIEHLKELALFPSNKRTADLIDIYTDENIRDEIINKSGNIFESVFWDNEGEIIKDSFYSYFEIYENTENSIWIKSLQVGIAETPLDYFSIVKFNNEVESYNYSQDRIMEILELKEKSNDID